MVPSLTRKPQACYTGSMAEIGILMLASAALTGAGLVAWRALQGPATHFRVLAARLLVAVVVSTSLVTFAAWKLSKVRTLQLLGQIVPRVETDHRVAALTFDDGPTTQFTEEVLQILGEKDVKATFFVTGKGLARHPDAGRQIVEQGHELGNHTYRHKRMVLKPIDFIEAEIEETDGLIRKTGYQGNIHFRAPGGKKLIVLPYYLRRTGRTSISWDVAPEGYSRSADDPERIAAQVLAETKPGSIILLHVMARSRACSRDALPAIIDGLQEQGYRLVTVSELLALR
jgi:peptidoglycan/xylan/chitin deacetylase (PgdA/CDA1 family)